MLKLAQNSSGAHRAQGINWLGGDARGCQESDDLVCSKVRNLGCGLIEAVMDNSQDRGLVQLIQVGWVFLVVVWVSRLQ